MEIVTDTLKTVLIVDGKEYQATGIYINRQTDNTLRKQGIKNATLLLPVQRIGSKTNSIVGTIDNVEVKTADPISSKDEYNKAAWTKVSVDTETNIADSKTEVFSHMHLTENQIQSGIQIGKMEKAIS